MAVFVSGRCICEERYESLEGVKPCRGQGDEAEEEGVVAAFRRAEAGRDEGITRKG